MAPHLGASTVEAQENVGKVIVEQVIETVRGGMVKNALNIPAVRPGIIKGNAAVPHAERQAR